MGNKNFSTQKAFRSKRLLGDGVFDPTGIQVLNDPINLPLINGTQTGGGDQTRVNNPTRTI